MTYLSKFTFSISVVRVVFTRSSSNTVSFSAIPLPVKIVTILIVAVRAEIVFEVTRAKRWTLAIRTNKNVINSDISGIGMATNTLKHKLLRIHVKCQCYWITIKLMIAWFDHYIFLKTFPTIWKQF